MEELGIKKLEKEKRDHEGRNRFIKLGGRWGHLSDGEAAKATPQATQVYFIGSKELICILK